MDRESPRSFLVGSRVKPRVQLEGRTGSARSRVRKCGQRSDRNRSPSWGGRVPDLEKSLVDHGPHRSLRIVSCLTSTHGGALELPLDLHGRNENFSAATDPSLCDLLVRHLVACVYLVPAPNPLV